MKICRMVNPAFLFLLVLCLFITGQSYGQKTSEQEKYQVDSTLFAYLQRCKAEIKSPAVMQMLDTLFLMSKEKGDERMQAVALSTKVDHFYFGPTTEGQEDSLILYTNLAKEFARRTNQPQYYYFAWSSRLITYYTRQRKFNLALYEANKMQQESEAREEIEGMQNCYQALFRIYQAKELYKHATVYVQKLIDLTLKYDLNKYNLTTKYLELGVCYLNLNEPEKALEAITESKKYILNEVNQGSYLCGITRYYTRIGDLENAGRTLKEASELFNNNVDLRNKRLFNYLEVATSYYMKTGEYDKALDTYLKGNEISTQQGYITPSSFRRIGTIYAGKKDYKRALENYEKAFALNDSLSTAQEDIAVGEFAAILGMEHLNIENKELIQRNQEIQLENRHRLILLLGIIAVGIGFMFFRELRINKLLRRAKDAEQSASRMKTEFIQNMSHEIRTPLNSIVGFSQVLSSSIADEDEEAKEYTNIIEKGSNHLLLLVDNVLELSDLDSGTPIPTDTEADMHKLCQECLKQIEDQLKPGVVLSYQPETEQEYCLHTNTAHLSRVILQLLDNAARFTEQGSITLSWSTLPKQKLLTISVTDTGIGIPQDKQEYVFERFAKLDTFSKGTGLGLSLGKLTMERMGGTLIIDSRYTAGCRFTLTLPIQ